LQNGDFGSVYREGGPALKNAIGETSFVTGIARVYKENGTLEKITPIAYQTGVDSKLGPQHVLLFDVTFERIRVRERMVFTRSQAGPMELADLVIDREG
jgi:hypothetical protein